MPREVVDARIQRLKLAIDLSTKHRYLSDDLQAPQDASVDIIDGMWSLVRIRCLCLGPTTERLQFFMASNPLLLLVSPTHRLCTVSMLWESTLTHRCLLLHVVLLIL